MQSTKIIVSFFIFLLLGGCYGNFSSQSNTANVQITGTGNSEDSALNNALANAVRNVAGQMIISERKVINDSLLDRMTSYSDGVINTIHIFDI
jgi:capsular polysaccharide biosynthesis protein